MKIQLLSDIHIDKNDKNSKEFSIQNKDIFTIIAGDIANRPNLCIDWIRKNIKNGIIVLGNHILQFKTPFSLVEIKQCIEKQFPIDSDVSLLDVDCKNFYKEVNGILFIGTTLYTDYNLTNRQKKELQKARYSTDFRYGIYSRKGGLTEPLTPKHYVKIFRKSIEMMDKVLFENEKDPTKMKPVVIITHYSPSAVLRKLPDYHREKRRASYSSNLDDFIERHPSIKLWCSGHTHVVIDDVYKRKDGSEVLLVTNPIKFNEKFISSNKSNNIIIDTDSWTFSR